MQRGVSATAGGLEERPTRLSNAAWVSQQVSRLSMHSKLRDAHIWSVVESRNKILGADLQCSAKLAYRPVTPHRPHASRFNIL